MKILWMNTDQMGCGTYRCYIPALSLQETGTADSHFILHKDAVGVIDHGYPDLEGTDLVIFQRPGAGFLRVIQQQCIRRGIKTIVELDDDMFHIPRHNPAFEYWQRTAPKRILHHMLGDADKVIVSTVPLAEVIREAMGWVNGSANRVAVCHNHLHPSVWGEEVWGATEPFKGQPGTVVIGWQGSKTHNVDFKEAVPALWRILEEFPQVTLRLFGSVPISIKGVIPESRFQWSNGVEFHKYPATLRYMNFDIGIAPITDCKFNRGKSNLKYLEYAALRVPCVASRVYPYAKAIDHGETGFLASTPDEWYTHLKALVLSQDLRQQIGEAAHRNVWETWSNRQHMQDWVLAFQQCHLLEDTWPRHVQLTTG